MIEPSLSCSEIEPLLDAFHDGETSKEESARVLTHLHECQACRQSLDEVKKVAASLKGLPLLTMSYDLSSQNWDFQNKAASIGGVVQGEKKHSGNPQPSEPDVSRISKSNVAPIAWGYRFRRYAVAIIIVLLIAVPFIFESIYHRPIIGMVKPTDFTIGKSTGKMEIANNKSFQDNQNLGTSVISQRKGEKNENLIALFPVETSSLGEDLGISTDEDGLYALKL